MAAPSWTPGRWIAIDFFIKGVGTFLKCKGTGKFWVFATSDLAAIKAEQEAFDFGT